MGDGTQLEDRVELHGGTEVDAIEWLEPLSDNYYYIVPEKCAECEGIFDHPQCLEVCPDPECIIIDPMHTESKDALRAKRSRLGEPERA